MSPELIRVPLDSAEARFALENGRFERESRVYAAFPLRAAAGSLVLEIRDPGESRRPSAVVRGWKAIRAVSLTASVTPCALTALYGVWRGWEPDLPIASLAAFGALLFQVAINLLNDVEDHLRMVDLPGDSGGSGVIQKGWVRARSMRRGGYLALVLGCLAGLPALVNSPELILFTGIVGVLGTIGYSGRPFSMKYRALGDVAVLVLCGPALAIGFATAAFHRIDAGVLAIGFFMGFAANGILHANNMRDLAFDGERGVVTLATLLGFLRSRWVLVAFYAAAWLSLVSGAVAGTLPPAVPVAAAFGAIPATSTVLRVFKASGPDSPILHDIRARGLMAHLSLGAFGAIGFLIAAFSS